MVDTPRPGPLAQFQDSIGVVTTEDETHGKGKKARAKPRREIAGHLQSVGWMSRQKSSRFPVEGKVFS
jgi:hypothetical protein